MCKFICFKSNSFNKEHKVWATQIFWAAGENLGKASF